MKITWSAPLPLANHAAAIPGPGIYIIGSPKNLALPVLGVPPMPADAYSGKDWPANFQPEYAGNSLAAGNGMRGRLKLHYERKGNEYISDLIGFGLPLFFIQASGLKAAEFEALFILLKKEPDSMSGNTRDECSRTHRREYNRARAGMSQSEQDHYDNLEPGEAL